MNDAGRAVVFDGELKLIRRPRPQKSEGEVLIKPILGGICNTDLELTKGYAQFSGVLGHEFVGTVCEGPLEWMGERVVGEINIACGVCDFCLRGIPSQCRNRSTLGIAAYDGVFADVFRLPVRNLWRVPSEVSDTEAVFVEPLAAACQVLEAAHISPTDRVVVIGAGKLGMLVAQVLKLTGVELQVVVRREKQAALVERWGIRAASLEEVGQNRQDVVIDCTGNAEGFAAALDMVRPRGLVVLKSTYAGMPLADLTRIAVDEIRVVGSRCGPFDAALRLLANKLVDVESLVDAEYNLDDALAAFEQAASPGALKVMLRMA